MATIGRGSAIADFGRVHLSGYVGWLAWLFVHIMRLVGFRNRLAVFFEWAWAYVSYQRSVRLITGDLDPFSWAQSNNRSEISTRKIANDSEITNR
jgi:NADH dehydrogenase